jgi:hypothetical protein
MAQVKSSSTVKLSVTLVLTEEEAIALNEMTKYGIDSFLKGYYKYLGKHYMKPHEKGMRSLFNTIDKELPSHLRRISDARKIFDMPKQIEPKASMRFGINKYNDPTQWGRDSFIDGIARIDCPIDRRTHANSIILWLKGWDDESNKIPLTVNEE